MIGLDFGTTNSAVARLTSLEPGASVRLARFRDVDGESWTEAFRSVLFFDDEQASTRQRPVPASGPEAIRAVLDTGGRGRFLQSLKSQLASRLFRETTLLGWKFTLEDLIALLLSELRRAAIAQLDDPCTEVVLGRPVHFVVGDEGSVDLEADAIAVERLRDAAMRAGFETVHFELEPVAAALEYESRLDHDELVLIGDFGGGTSDFSLLRLGPRARKTADRRESVLGVDGVPVAGGAFDARLVRHHVAPRFGLGSDRRTAFDQVLPMPVWIYRKLERWEDLSFLKTRENLETIRRLQHEAASPRAIEGLLHLIENDRGYELYRAVEGLKLALSVSERATLSFREPPVNVHASVTREAFEEEIADLRTAIDSTVERLLNRSGIGPGDVDRVFLTGGSSLVPSVRQCFAARFGEERLRGGQELTSVARGLARARIT